MGDSEIVKALGPNEDALRMLMGLPIGAWEATDLLLARDGLGLTQAELAAEIGYDRSAIAKIEGGDLPPRRVVELAVRYLIARRPEGTRFSPRAKPEVSRFRFADEAIGISEAFPFGQDTNIFLMKGPVIWLRLMPEFASERRFSAVELKRVATQAGFPLVQLMDGYSSLGFVRGVDGFGVYPVMNDRSITPSVSYILNTGEIWAVDAYLLNIIRQQQQAGNHKIGVPYFEDRFKYVIHSFAALLIRLEFSRPFRWIAGVEGIKDAGLFFPAPTGHYFAIPIPQGRSLEDRIYDAGTLTELDTPASALRPFFQKMFDTFAVPRPEYLDNLSNPS